MIIITKYTIMFGYLKSDADMRKLRGKTQNIFLIEATNTNSLEQRQYSVMGLTGNVYTVIINEKPTCTCPDFKARQKRCKHIYFILTRVMKVPDNKEDSKTYTLDELTTMFSNIPAIMKNLVVDDNKKHKYEQMKDKPDKKVDMKSLDDMCPICLDDFEDGDTNNVIDYCKYSCGKPIHKICFEMWAKKKGFNCVFCNHKWNNDTNSNYINLK